MLERTAAGIEICSLQRVLPAAVGPSLATRRRLHTNFWHHGATDFELLDACRSLVLLPSAGPDAAPVRAQPNKKSDAMTASTFLLDFLYPSGAAALLQRLRPTFPLRSDSGHPPSKVAVRSYASSVLDRETTEVSLAEGELQDASSFSPTSHEQGENKVLKTEIVGHPWANLSAPTPSSLSGPQALRGLLDSKHGQSFDLVWRLYSELEPSLQEEFRPDVVLNLSRSPRREDTEKLSELFSEIKPKRWKPNLVDAAIKASLSLDKPSAALAIYEAALSKRFIGMGLDALLTHGLKVEDWNFVLNVLALSATAMSSSRDVRFRELAALPNLQRQISRLYFHLGTLKDKMTVLRRTGQLHNLLQFMARKSALLFQPADANFILDLAMDPHAYELYISFCMDEGRWKQAGELYKKYRKLPGVRIRVETLRAMLDSYYPHDVRGMEGVLEDWYHRYDHLELRAYQKMISFYARRGDVKSVARLAQEYAVYYPESVKCDPTSLISSRMHVHAVRGEPAEARRILEETAEDWGRQPGPLLWNILLNAHSRANDYEGAIDAFSRLCEVGNPDSTSFGTVMGMAAARGDLEFTLELYKLASEKGVKANLVMVERVVQAYCQNDRFSEAESLCLKMTRDRPMKGDYAILWNTLLQYYAARRDLKMVNFTLDIMTKYDVPYNNKTYSHLLTGLINCRQSHHALHFLKVSLEQNAFRPTQDHYLLLMAAFIESQEPEMVLMINRHMSKMGFQRSTQRVTKVIDALGNWKKLPSSKKYGEDGRHHISKALAEFKKTVKRGGAQTTSDSAATVDLYSQMAFVLTQLRDFSSVEDIITLYQRQFPSSATPETLPIKLLNNIMLADLYEEKHDRVKSTWEIIFDRTLRESKMPHSDLDASAGKDNSSSNQQSVFLTHRFRLSDPLKTMQRLYIAGGDADALTALVARVREHGFELDSKNWNYYVQGLAKLKRLKEAFEVCEEQLMPQWTGWYRVRARTPGVKNLLPLEMRRIGSNPRRPRPISHTMLVLAKAYTDLEQRTLWSKNASRLYDAIRRDCPHTAKAVTTMLPAGSELEQKIFFGKGARDAEAESEPTEDPSGLGSSDAAEPVETTNKVTTAETANRALESQERSDGAAWFTADEMLEDADKAAANDSVGSEGIKMLQEWKESTLVPDLERQEKLSASGAAGETTPGKRSDKPRDERTVGASDTGAEQLSTEGGEGEPVKESGELGLERQTGDESHADPATQDAPEEQQAGGKRTEEESAEAATATATATAATGKEPPTITKYFPKVKKSGKVGAATEKDKMTREGVQNI